MQEIALSPYGQASVAASPVSRMMAQFAADFRAGVDINLGVGYVNESTIPRRRIVEALDYVAEHPSEYRAPFNYGGPAGAPYLIQALHRFLVRRRAGGLTADVLQRQRTVIGVSGATSLLEALAAVLRPGFILTSDPNYYIYANLLERAGFEIIAVPEDDRGIRIDLLEAMIASLGQRCRDVSFVYLPTVSNPTCSILANDRRRDLVGVVATLSRRLGRKVPLFLDTAYELLIHDPAVTPPRSALLDDDMGLVYEVGTLSKILAPALRIGYMIGPPSPMLDAIVEHVSDVGFSAPLANQAVAAHLLEHAIDEQIVAVNRGYREKAVRIRGWIDEYLGDHVEHCVGGSAGFYYYLTFRAVETHEASPFFRYLARTTGDVLVDGPNDHHHPRVIYIPGQFCVHPRGQLTAIGRRQLRLSYGFEELPRIEHALRMMAEACAYAVRSGSASPVSK